ncbi:hypothetical protein [Arthrobacter sp. NPDC056493]|uniref:hypothetical protein n=1 Tax=Arthrobacter sp. NPDC056493 TaxID=3345839 RepID=UPI003672F69E
MTSSDTKTHVGLLSVLTPGDCVEAHSDEGLRWAGNVELVAPSLGMVWIQTDKGERKALDIYDFEIQTC